MDLLETKAYAGQSVLIYIETKLENDTWPTDAKEIQKIIKKNKKAPRTKGLVNLGNTCYLNSALQALANTPYFKDYFTTNEQMGFEPY